MRVRLEPLTGHFRYKGNLAHKGRVQAIDRVLVWQDDGEGGDFPLCLMHMDDFSDFPELGKGRTTYAIMTFEREGAA